MGSALVAVLAFAPFRDNGDRPSVLAGSPTTTIAGAGGAIDGDAGIGGPDAGTGEGATTGGGPAGGTGSPGGSTGSTAPGPGGPANPTPTPDVPDLPEPTDEQLAVLGPLIRAMDTGQRAGTPLVLGIATSIVATGLPSEADLPPELRPVLAAIGDLLATPGMQVNELTAQNSVYLAQLDRALGELAFANPALNAVIHQTADQLAAMGRAAEPVSPPGGVFLADLAILLTYFVVD